MALTRSDFQALASARIDDAKILLKRKRWDASYYLAGYAVECALKACIIKRVIRPDEWFPSPEFSRKCFTHDLALLCRIAELLDDIENDVDVKPNWIVIKDWSEETRYTSGRSEDEVKHFIKAITDKKHGVLPWLQKFW